MNKMVVVERRVDISVCVLVAKERIYALNQMIFSFRFCHQSAFTSHMHRGIDNL